MRPKQNYEVGKYFLTTSQIILGTRVITTLFIKQPIEWLSVTVNIVVASVLFLIGIYFVGRSE